MSGFSVASLLCGTATTLEELILYRVLQGILGAPITPLSQAIILSSFERRNTPWRPRSGDWCRMRADYGAHDRRLRGGSLQLALGLFMTFPICVVSVFTVFVFITDRERNPDIRLDWTGFLALSIAVASFQLMIDRGERLDWFDPVKSS